MSNEDLSKESPYFYGMAAYANGEDHTDCPYKNPKDVDAWMRGWTEALQAQEEQRLKDGHYADRG